MRKLISFRTFKKHCGSKVSGIPIAEKHCRILKHERDVEYPKYKCTEGNCPVWKRLRVMPFAW